MRLPLDLVPANKTKKQQLLTVDLQHLKCSVLDAAQAAGKRPSVWVRELVAQSLQMTAPSPSASPAPNLTNVSAPKLTLRLTQADHQRLGELAREEGLSRSQWLLHRIRHPTAPAVTPEQATLLGTSNYQLAGLGRNLNQVARSLNGFPGRTTASDREAIQQAIEAIQKHLQVASAVMEALPRAGRQRRGVREAS